MTNERNQLLNSRGANLDPNSCLPANGPGSFQHMTRELYRLGRMENKNTPPHPRETLNLRTYNRRYATEGKLGYILAWLIGIPIPVLIIVFLLRGCH